MVAMHLHILGIGGTFMGGLAALAREAGHRVTGCDAGVYPPMSTQLERLGITLHEGYGIEQLDVAPDVFVVGNVVSRARLANGQAKFALMEAVLERGLPYTSGPQWLAEHVLRGRHVLAVAGTHGKTTTTAMLAWILQAHGLEPGFLIGGVPANFEVSARLGAADAPFVIEADEYDTAFFDKRSKFLHYRARTAVLNNLEFDHADIFNDLAAIERQFAHWLRLIPANGRVVVADAEPALQRVLAQAPWCPTTTFGQVTSDWAPNGSAQQFDVLHHGQQVANVQWSLSGEHNQRNALAAIAAATEVGVGAAQAAHALTTFGGVARRMQELARVPWQGQDMVLYDDFAHHPSAMATTLDGLRQALDAQTETRAARIVAVFEPRSHTMQLGTLRERLPQALRHADRVLCHTANLTWDAAQTLQPLAERAYCTDNVQDAVATVRRWLQPGDRVVVMSNGGFGGIHAELAQAMRDRATDQA